MELLTAAALTITLGIPGRASATPSIAAKDALVAVAWSAATPDGTTDIYADVSHDGGRTFGPPVRVNDVAGDARVNGEQPPHVVIVSSPAPRLVIVWTTKGRAGTKLVQAESRDGGRSFTRAHLVPGSDAAGNRGWEATTVDRRGQVDAVWLDHRGLAAQDADMATMHHQTGGATAGKPDGVAMAQRSKLYFASLDGALEPHAVTGGVCYCCKTALASGPDGTLYAAWRHVFPGNLRDIAFTLSRDDGRTFAPPLRVSEDKWMIEGCPDDGPAMAVDAAGRVHIVWPTLVTAPGGPTDQTIALFGATSRDGQAFSARQRLPTEGVAHHPQLAVARDGTLIAAWDESAGGSRRVVVARGRLDADGRAQFTRSIVSESSRAIYPAVAVSRDRVVAAWTSVSGDLSSIAVAGLPLR